MSATKRNVVFIFGAGASAAIFPQKIPCMGDYFEKLLIQIEEKELTEYWLPLASVEEARVFHPNPEAETLATRIRTIQRQIDDFKNEHLDEKAIGKLEDARSTHLRSYISAFKEDDGRRKANLEKILTTLESLDPNDSTGGKFHLVTSINTFFRTLDIDLVETFKHAPHQKLAEFLNVKENLDVTVISFNYDLWLEKALQKHGLWNPSTGYGHEFLYVEPSSLPQGNFVGFLGHREPKPFSNRSPSRVNVLKPNGSCSWFSVDGSKPIVLTSNGEETGQISYNSDITLGFTDVGNRRGVTPSWLIVPPIPTATRRHPVFWSIDQKIQTCLREADALIVIGWSLPDTDQKFAKDFERAMNSRESQLPALILCDTALGKNDSRKAHAHKFESLFRPASPAVTKKEGFDEAFVRSLGEHL